MARPLQLKSFDSELLLGVTHDGVELLRLSSGLLTGPIHHVEIAETCRTYPPLEARP